MSVRGYIQTLLNALPVGTRQPVQQAFDALYTERSGVTPGTYGSSTAIPVLTIDARGRVTAASESTFTASAGSTSASTAAGNVTYSSAAGSEPSANPGDLYFPTDGFGIGRYSGSAWPQWGPVWPLTDPATGGAPTTWVNQGSATLTTTRRAYVLSVPAGSGSDNFRFLVKTAPATPYTITALYLTDHWPLNFFMSGLFFRQSSDGKLISCDYNVNSASRVYEVVKFTNPTTFSAAVALTSPSRTLGDAALVWMQISDDGTNRKMHVSVNGYDWLQMYSEARTTFLTADQVGWGVNAYSNVRGYTMTLLSWKET